MYKEGYIAIVLFRKLRLAHRLVFLWVNGELPPDQVDHINGVKDDNRLINLRMVSNMENTHNQKLRITNSSGIMGVNWHKRDEKWQAYISINKRFAYLGSFTDKFEAICARKSAENRHGYHKNHGRIS